VTEMQQVTTSFSGLANTGQTAEVYSGLIEMGEATKEGDYEKNTKGLKKPWILPIRRPPITKWPI
jgi:hypothetical protein